MVIVEEGKPNASALVVVSVDSIAVTAPLTIDVAKWAEEKFGLTAQSTRVVQHTLARGPSHSRRLGQSLHHALAEDEKQKIKAYTDALIAGIKRSIDRIRLR